MSWTLPADLRAQVEKLWARGDLLSSILSEANFFPRKLMLKTPTSSELAQRFDEVRDWVREISVFPHCRIETRSFNHRVLGNNEIPDEVWIDNVEAAVALISKQTELTRFREIIALTTARQPDLLPWLSQRSLFALKHADSWTRLLAVVGWIANQPRPNIYLRQISIAGIHSKFIEDHKGVLSALLDIVLPPECINHDASGSTQFELRYGFKEKPIFIRLRALDPSIFIIPGQTRADVSIDATSFANLSLGCKKVLITENEVNFLSLPTLSDCVAIFGKGYGWDAIARAAWLQDCMIYYWGDIDTHGFAILDQLRSYLPHTQSVLMDRDTLLNFEQLWGEELQPTNRNLTRLNTAELSLYEALCEGSLGLKVRLEQEHIGFDWAMKVLRNLP
jgi:hypothetical protein